MNINFARKLEDDGTLTIIVTFRDVPDEEQALAAENIIKRALLGQGAAGVIPTELLWATLAAKSSKSDT